jgi:hypothetical protein
MRKSRFWRGVWRACNVEKLRKALEKKTAHFQLTEAKSAPSVKGVAHNTFTLAGGAQLPGSGFHQAYAAPKRTDTSFDMPGSCMVTP